MVSDPYEASSAEKRFPSQTKDHATRAVVGCLGDEKSITRVSNKLSPNLTKPSSFSACNTRRFTVNLVSHISDPVVFLLEFLIVQSKENPDWDLFPLNKIHPRYPGSQDMWTGHWGKPGQDVIIKE